MTKSIGILSASALFLLLGFSAAAVTHQEPQEKPRIELIFYPALGGVSG
jgi:hypothetical protein